MMSFLTIKRVQKGVYRNEGLLLLWDSYAVRQTGHFYTTQKGSCLPSVIKWPTDSTTSTTSGQKDTMIEQTSTASREMSTTSVQTSTTSVQTSTTSGQTSSTSRKTSTTNG